jgi:hypothetical protein
MPVGCERQQIDAAQVAAIQVAAAAEVIEGLVENPGAIVAACVGYSGDWEDAGLPVVPGRIGVSYMDGCEEVDGRLRARDGGGQAISVSVGSPEMTSESESTVRVFTSTGSIDMASYACTIRGKDAAWIADGCRLEAIS